MGISRPSNLTLALAATLLPIGFDSAAHAALAESLCLDDTVGLQSQRLVET
jgi:hypothetical protein